MTGRRLPVVDGKVTYPTQPGDYCGPVVGYTGDKPAVFFLPPNARTGDRCSIHHVVSPPHSFDENPDGTLTIHGSVLSTRYHGLLERGVWRECN